MTRTVRSIAGDDGVLLRWSKWPSNQVSPLRMNEMREQHHRNHQSCNFQRDANLFHYWRESAKNDYLIHHSSQKYNSFHQFNFQLHIIKNEKLSCYLQLFGCCNPLYVFLVAAVTALKKKQAHFSVAFRNCFLANFVPQIVGPIFGFMLGSVMKNRSDREGYSLIRRNISSSISKLVRLR